MSELRDRFPKLSGRDGTEPSCTSNYKNSESVPDNLIKKAFFRETIYNKNRFPIQLLGTTFRAQKSVPDSLSSRELILLVH